MHFKMYMYTIPSVLKQQGECSEQHFTVFNPIVLLITNHTQPYRVEVDGECVAVLFGRSSGRGKSQTWSNSAD